MVINKAFSRRTFLSGVTAAAAASYLPLSSGMMSALEAKDNLDIAVDCDLRGHLVGTVSKDSGKTPITGAKIQVKGTTPAGPWTEQAITDERGFFRTALPLGSNATIDIAAVYGNVESKASVSGSDLPQRLTPRPETAENSRFSLDGDWSFAVDPPVEFPQQGSVATWHTITTPSNWEMEGYVAESGVAVFRKHFVVPASWAHKRIKLRAEAIYSGATLWLNGKRLGAHNGGATTFEVDLTEAAQVGKRNELVILVHARTSTTDLDKISFYSYWNIAGIWRPLEIFCVEPVHVSRLAVNADFAADSGSGELVLEIDIDNESASRFDKVQISARLLDPEGNKLALQGLNSQLSLGPWERKTARLIAKISQVRQWNAENPALYTTLLDVRAGQQVMEQLKQTVGFRRIEIKGRQYLLNGQPVKFWGTSYLPVHPLKGRAIGSDLHEQDFACMKKANINTMRFTVLTPHHRMLELADQEGMYVEMEAPFCWAGSDWFGPGVPHIDTSDLRFAPLYVRIMSEVIECGRNHVSVSLWSIGNESTYGRNFARMRDFVHESDPTRPASFALQTKDVDVATFHNPLNLPRLALADQLQTPVLWDEALCNFQSGQSNGEGLELDPGLRDYWVVPHPAMLTEARRRPQLMGALIWAWIDDTVLLPGRFTHYWRTGPLKKMVADAPYRTPGRGVAGDFMWGTVDGWRRARPEYFLTKKLYSPIFIEDKPLTIPAPGSPIMIPVENRNVFRNLNHYQCEWTLGKEHGVARANVAPMASGSLQILASPRPKDELFLRFKDEKQATVDTYRLPFSTHSLPAWPKAELPAEIWNNPLIYLSSMEEVRLRGAHSEIFFEPRSGALLGGLVSGRQVLIDGPRLHVLNNTSPLQENPSSWKFEKTETQTRGKQAIIRKFGKYGDLYDGYFDIAMDYEGNLEFSYHFTYNGPPVNTREIGLAFELPVACDHLTWDRQAEYSDYPEDHIGRPKGSAVAHPSVPQVVPPTNRPFGLDDHPWGSNDFRSTKRNIYMASLTSADGAGMEIISNGTQHLRATVGTFSICLHINDYFGGSNVGTSEWDDLYGNGHRLKPGEVVEGMTRVRMLGGRTSQ
jgi:beta-galactosidase